MSNKLCCCVCFFLFSHLLLMVVVCSKNHGNPANEIVNIINNNRTAHKLPALNDSPGLGCMALQYVEFCKSNCSNNNNTVHCKPSEDEFTEVFAPNCGVELPTFGTITGHILGCESKYVEPSLAFTHVLVRDNKALSILRNKSHYEVGVGMVKVHKGPVLWGILFSNDKTNSTFVLEDRGMGIKQKTGCYSGSNLPCSAAQKHGILFSTNVMFLAFLQVCLLLI